MKTLNTLTAIAAFFTTTAFAQTETQDLVFSVTYNSNLIVPVTKSMTVEFTNQGIDGLDTLDLGNENSISNRPTVNDSVYIGPQSYAYPFTLSASNTIITGVDSRPELQGYKTIPFGFATADSATINLDVNALFSTGYNFSGTNLPTYYIYLERIATGEIVQLLNQTTTLNIPENSNFQADYLLHIMPKPMVTTTPVTCFGGTNGSISIHNPLCTTWNYSICLNGVTLFTSNVTNPDTTLYNFSSDYYDVTVHINGMLADSDKVLVDSPADVNPYFISLSGNSAFIGDAIFFMNASSGADTYSWNFGDATTDSITNPTHSFSTAGTFAVTLTATSVNGCTATFTDSMFIADPNTTVHQAPSFDRSSTENSNSTMRNSLDVNVATGDQKITVNQNTEAQEINVQISNMNGQLIASTSTTSSSISFDLPQNGIYLVTVTTANGQMMSKKVLAN